MGEEPIKKEESRVERDELGRFLPGSVPNPHGRPKGKTIKERVRDWLEEHPDEMEKFVEHFVKENRELAWQMLEGRPFQDILSGGEKLPTPILNVFSSNGGKEDSGTEKKD